MVYSYECIDLIVKRSALKVDIRDLDLPCGCYDSKLVLLPLSMAPSMADDIAETYSKRYGFSLPDCEDASNFDSVFVANGEGPLMDCDWLDFIEEGCCYQMKGSIRKWDADKWLKDFKESCAKNNPRKNRIEVYEHTQYISEKGGYTINGKKIKLDRPDPSIVYKNRIKLPAELSLNSDKAEIEVLNEDCLLTARRLKDEKPLILNMASGSTPGGGVVNGAGAQEECLFRSSNYFKSMYSLMDAYPMDRNHGGIYTSGVTVFRDLEDKGYSLLEEPFKADFVAVPAIKLRDGDLENDGHLKEEIRKGTMNKIRTILNIAILHNHRTLILSAFGCGAYHNPPEDISRLFKDILDEEPYAHFFKKVIFSIKSDSNDPANNNYTAFAECFRK